jgi:hypothetical protein
MDWQGFARYGHFDHAEPIIITYNLEAFFKIAQTGYAVALVILPSLCDAQHTEFKPFDFEQMAFVIHQLAKAGYTKLYMPVRPEHIQLEGFQKLEQDTALRLLNQHIVIDEQGIKTDYLIELYKDDDAEDVAIFIDESIKLLSPLVNGVNSYHWSQAETSVNSTYPIHALPPLARDAVIAIAEHVQAPIGMTAQCVIGAMSHIAQAHVNAPHPFNPQGEPCSLYLLTEGKAEAVKVPVVIWQTRPLFSMSVNNMSYTAVTLNNGKAVKQG